MTEVNKKYKNGFYGGKFLPLHKGHKYCIDVASAECETLHVILFINGADELRALKQSQDESLSLENRTNALNCLVDKYDNVVPVIVDVSECRLEDGSEDWDAETPLVINAIGKFDVVYSSEPSYEDYFSRAYPWAKHVLIDPPRIHYPISGTAIRAMKTETEKDEWRI